MMKKLLSLRKIGSCDNFTLSLWGEKFVWTNSNFRFKNSRKKYSSSGLKNQEKSKNSLSYHFTSINKSKTWENNIGGNGTGSSGICLIYRWTQYLCYFVNWMGSKKPRNMNYGKLLHEEIVFLCFWSQFYSLSYSFCIKLLFWNNWLSSSTPNN